MAGTKPPSKKRTQSPIAPKEIGKRKRHKNDDDTIMEEFINASITVRKKPFKEFDDSNDDEAQPEFSDTQICKCLADCSDAKV